MPPRTFRRSSTDDFIMALKRFTARRGLPQSIHCDNGTNFVDASNELWKCIKLLDEERIQNFCVPKAIEWKFQLPSVPHKEDAEGNSGRQDCF